MMSARSRSCELSSRQRLLFRDVQRRFFHNNGSKSVLPPKLVQVYPAVQQALEAGRPVVALESTIVAHGMPFPENLNLSTRVASILRSRGVEPATIAVQNGVCRVGLSTEELHDLACAGPTAQKCSTRQLSLLVAAHRRQQQRWSVDNDSSSSTSQSATAPAWTTLWGATTVASTMTLAHAAGISTFVTGGIGGVHRGGHESMDVSADIQELARTPVIVVSAGIKSILDIPRTLEVLETNSVPTVAYQTDEFPAFFSPHSGVAAPARVESAEEIAYAYWAARDLGLSHGMLVAVPNDDPAGANVERAIQSALLEADEQGISGPHVTPFILKRVAEKTGGESLRSNMALVERNAAVGAEIALSITNIQRQRTTEPRVYRFVQKNTHSPSCGHVVVVGGAVVDIVARPKHEQELILGTSNPACCTESDGGVGRNIAEALGRLGSNTLLYSAVGNDSRGQALLHRLANECNVQTPEQTITIVNGYNTSTYLAVLDHANDLHVACADMDVLDQIQSPPESVFENAALVVMDANPPATVLRETAQLARKLGVKVLWEPTSVPKARLVAQDDEFMSCLSYATPNFDELVAMVGSDKMANEMPTGSDALHAEQVVDGLKQLATIVLDRMNPERAHLVVTLGASGVLLAIKEPNQQYTFRHILAQKDFVVRNATGAGDSLTGAFVHALIRGKSEMEAVSFGVAAASKSLECEDRAIPPSLSELKLSQ